MLSRLVAEAQQYEFFPVGSLNEPTSDHKPVRATFWEAMAMIEDRPHEDCFNIRFVDAAGLGHRNTAVLANGDVVRVNIS